ncbi:MAG: AMP-binding protein [Desulfarculaceae bacterium]|jgi:2,3-dihydroxybenzoate-AMP ligase/mycobactin salicyl-AMP ligase
MPMEGFQPYEMKAAELYSQKRWWLGLTMGDVFDKTCDLYPDKEGLVAGEQRYTFARLRQQVDTLAYWLLEDGVAPGDRVLLQLPNWAEFVISYFALQKIGAVMVLLTVNHTAREIAHLAKLTQPTGWILPAAYRGHSFQPLVEQVMADNPDLTRLIVKGEDFPLDCAELGRILGQEYDPGVVKKALDANRPDPGEVCQILPSGGTTGLPKGAPRTHNDYLVNVEYKTYSWDLNPTDTCLVGTTVGHNLALLVTVNGPIFQGAKMVLLDSTKPEDFCTAVEAEKVTCTGLVPTLISRIVNYERLTDYDLSSLKRIYVGAANSPPDLVQQVEEKIGCRYFNAFGMVEGPCLQTRPTHSREVRSSTIGRPVCPYDQIVTLDSEGRRTPPGVEGELAAKGPGIFTGYYRNPQANQSSFTPDGFFRTGDLAVIDPQGTYRITGRIKDIIIRGGENIAATEVEELISSHAQVEYVAVIGMPDPDLGETVCAYVTPVRGAGLSQEDLTEHLRSEGVAKAMIPTHIEFMEQIPLTAAGKADKKALKADIEKKLA